MKSTILAVLPFVGAAFAESVCSRKTVTHTEYAQVYETVKAADVKPKPSSCSRRTVTATTTEKVYVTVDAKITSTVDVTSTSTTTRTTTITVHPSQPAATSSVPSYPTIGSQSVQPEYSIQYTPVPQSEVPNPTPTSQYEAPSESSAAPEPPKEVDSAGAKKGDATFYGGNVGGGMCSFTGYTIPSDLFGTALSDSNWSGGANCGACLEITGPSGNKVTAMVVDQCPDCGPNHVDLFPDAFAELADPSKGVIPVSWNIVSCGITSPIVLKNKEGTSKFWFSMQVMNSNIPVSKLEVSTDGGNTWQATTRQEYNFFEQSSGFGTDSVDVKVTSTNGGSIVVKGVSIAAGSTKTADSNFS